MQSDSAANHFKNMCNFSLKNLYASIYVFFLIGFFSSLGIMGNSFVWGAFVKP